MHVTSRACRAPPPHTDGIVALTGGAGRVELALHLLADGQADKLLLSGIGGGSDLATLGRLAGIDTARFADRITLGRYAASTRGNGVETAAWAEQNRIRTLIVVTAAYHMPRALAELRQALPDVRLYPDAGRMPGAGRKRPGIAAGSGGVHEVSADRVWPVRLAPVPGVGFRVRRDSECRRMMVLRSALFNVVFFAVSFVMTLLASVVRIVAPGVCSTWPCCGRVPGCGGAGHLRHPAGGQRA